jgi:hypothetical protein
MHCNITIHAFVLINYLIILWWKDVWDGWYPYPWKEKGCLNQYIRVTLLTRAWLLTAIAYVLYLLLRERSMDRCCNGYKKCRSLGHLVHCSTTTAITIFFVCFNSIVSTSFQYSLVKILFFSVSYIFYYCAILSSW